MSSLSRLVWIPGSSTQSKWRNLFSYAMFMLSLVLLAEWSLAVFRFPLLQRQEQGFVLVAISVIYFAVVIVGVLFLVATRHGVAPIRLARDGVISMFLNLMAFSVLYRNYGISLTDTCIGPETTEAISSIYFSMVTFSTLGYGDFRPCDVTRLWAASQAIVGNLHLAILVAAAFLVASPRKARVRIYPSTRLQARRLPRRKRRLMR